MIVVITDEFRKSLRKLNNNDVNRKILETIENIENAQTTQDIRSLKKLKGYKTAYRIRIGNYRVGIHLQSETVHFNCIASRKDIYDEFP